jgi:ABC-2 type transport system permease protein
MFGEIKEIIKYRELLKNLVLRDIKVRYKRSIIGFIWVMLNPLLTMIILYVVFSELFKVTTQNYIAYLLSGIVLWNLYSQSTSTAIISFLGNGSLIKKIYLPKAIFPLSILMSATLHFLFSLIPLFVILFITETKISPNSYLLPIVILMLLFFSYGITLITSTLTVFFHDTRYVYEVLLLAWMYITPIFYPESIIPERFSFILKINPLYYFLTLFRHSLYMDDPYVLEKLIYGLFLSILSFIIGWLFYSRFKDKIVYYL